MTTIKQDIDAIPMTEVQLADFTPEMVAAIRREEELELYRAWKKAGMTADQIKPEYRADFLAA